MRLLVLGGTLFLGRHVVADALARGHRVTIFHRGRTNPGLFPEAEHVLGDRDGGLAALGTRSWDAVVDTSGYVPRVVRASARRFADCAHYTFVSSLSVYSTHPAGADESCAVATLDDPTLEGVTGETYGPLKALCERAAEEALPGRVLNVRAGLLVGPYDSTDRFPYWPRRVAAGGEVLAPAPAEAPVQFVDARDVAEWIVRMAEARGAGTFHATGPATPLAIGSLLDECRRVTGSDARFVWADESFLLGRGVRPWTDLPLWIPTTEPGFHRVSNARALVAGLTFRPLAETIRDTLDWDRETPASARPARSGVAMPGPLEAAREAELLAGWRATAGRRSG